MFAPYNEKAPQERGYSSAPKRTRTSTDQMVHKALNLARRNPPSPRAKSMGKLDIEMD